MWTAVNAACRSFASPDLGCSTASKAPDVCNRKHQANKIKTYKARKDGIQILQFMIMIIIIIILIIR